MFVRVFAPSTWPTRAAAGSGTDRVAPPAMIGPVDAAGADGAAEAAATGTPVTSPATAAAQPSTLRRECTRSPDEPSDDATPAPSVVHTPTLRHGTRVLQILDLGSTQKHSG